MSHFDRISELAPGFEVAAYTADCPIAAAQNVEKNLYAIQFHPEVLHTVNGTEMIKNFVRGVCGCVRRLEDGYFRRAYDPRCA